MRVRTRRKVSARSEPGGITSKTTGGIVLLTVGLGFVGIGVWTLFTSSNVILGWGSIVLGVAFCVYALLVVTE